MVCICNESCDPARFCLSSPQEVSILPELTLGDLPYDLTGVLPQPNSPPDAVPGTGCCRDVTFVAFISDPISRSWSVLLPPKSCTVTILKCISCINESHFKKRVELSRLHPVLSVCTKNVYFFKTAHSYLFRMRRLKFPEAFLVQSQCLIQDRSLSFHLQVHTTQNYS